jgi:ankyrin repeat protein
MDSVGAECAMHLSLPEEIARLAGRCLDARIQLEDLEGRLMAATAGCRLLAQVHREDLNERFARHLLEAGRQYEGLPNALHEGYRGLVANVEKTRRDDLVREIAGRAEELYGLFGKDTDPLDLYATLHRIESSDWYLGAVGPSTRKRLDQARQIWDAAHAGDVTQVEALLGDGADANARCTARGGLPTALITAAFGGHTDLVRFLLERGADPEIPNGQGRTALMLAADQGHADAVTLLLEKGARPERQDYMGQTALHIAGWQGYTSAVKALLRGGASPETRDRTGNTPLALAATEDVPEVVTALLDGGADIAAANDHCQTPLMNAAMEGKARIVTLLLGRGANAAVRDGNGMTALDWARQEKHAEAEALLKQHL